jgi:hypothetical protein
METVRRLTYFKAAYSEIKRAHVQEHAKGVEKMSILMLSP